MTATAHIDKYGGAQVPVTAGSPGVSLATTCDPAVAGLLADFAAIINTKCSTAYAAAMGLMSQSGKAVDSTFIHEPNPTIAKRTWNGPALFLWRASERFGERTNVHSVVDATVKLAYILPPMRVEEAIKFEPIRVAVRTTLIGFVKSKGDATLNPGTELSKYGIDSFRWTDSSYGYFDNEANLEMPFAVLDMTALMREREEWVLSQWDALDRVDTTITSKDDAGGETTVVETYYEP